MMAKDVAMKTVKNDPLMQGEGNVTAARRVRKATETFVAQGKVADAARKAAPQTPAEAETLRTAEAKGLAKARR